MSVFESCVSIRGSHIEPASLRVSTRCPSCMGLHHVSPAALLAAQNNPWCSLMESDADSVKRQEM